MPKGETRNTRARKASEKAEELIDNPPTPDPEQVQAAKDRRDSWWHRKVGK